MVTIFFLQLWAGLITITTILLIIGALWEERDRKITQRWWKGRCD